MHEIHGHEPMVDMASRKFYPTFSLDVDDIPEALNWKVGEDYAVEMIVKQIAMRSDDEEGKKRQVTFEIRGVKAKSKQPKETHSKRARHTSDGYMKA